MQLFNRRVDELERHRITVPVPPGQFCLPGSDTRAGAPLGHDFGAINLSDNLKPFAEVERRVRHAARGGFAMAFYNPRSRARPHQFGQVLSILRAECEPARLILFARAVSTPEESLTYVTLAEAAPEIVARPDDAS